MRPYFFLALLFFGSINAVMGQQIFQRTYGGTGDEFGRAIINLSSGGYAVAGTSNSFSENSTDVYLLKLDEDGDYIWGRHFGGAGIDRATDLIEMAAGSLYICGFTNSFGNGGYDVLLMKVSADGSLVWQKSFGGSNWDFGAKILQQDNFLYICGSTTAASREGYLIKVDFDGNLIWAATMPGSGPVEFSAISFSENNEVICIGTATSSLLGQEHIAIGVFDQDGSVIRSFIIDNPDHVQATDGVYTGDNKLAISANRNGDTVFGDQDQFLLMVNILTGEVLWSIDLGTAEFDSANGIALTADNDLALAGSVYHYTPQASNVYAHVFRIGLDGAYLAGGSLNILAGSDNGHSEFFDIIKTPDDGFICAGHSSAFGYNNQVYLLKVNAANELDTTNQNYVDLATATSEPEPPSVQLYPNPAGSVVNISAVSGQAVEYKIFSVEGQVLQQGQAISPVQIQTGTMAPGVYFIEITTNRHSHREKLVIR